jgi:heat-inducible transcriptional repressor
VLRGMANFLNFPEYSNVQKAREIMQFLDNTENIRKAVVPSRSIEKPRIEIIIGKENHASEMKDCSMIVSRFKTGGEGYGTIGVIGPTRMDYSKAVSTLEFLTKQLEEMGYDL